MRLLERWLSEMSPSQRVLDLGCGSGSLKSQTLGLRVVGIDVNVTGLARASGLTGVCGRCQNLPFADGSFDFAISHHSLEHFRDAESVILEVGRVLKTSGRLFVSVPEGASFSDRLYRLMFCGGDHWQRFSFESVVGAIESGTGLRLAGSQEMFTSFIYVDRRNFLAAPVGPLPGPLPRRMRWLGCAPGSVFSACRLLLNVGTRVADRLLGTHLSRYGWALAFARDAAPVQVEPGVRDVCMYCGSGADGLAGYRCPDCGRLNPHFGI